MTSEMETPRSSEFYNDLCKYNSVWQFECKWGNAKQFSTLISLFEIVWGWCVWKRERWSVCECVWERVKKSVTMWKSVWESVWRRVCVWERMCESVKRYFCAVTCHNYLFCKHREILVTCSNAQKFSLLFLPSCLISLLQNINCHGQSF